VFINIYGRALKKVLTSDESLLIILFPLKKFLYLHATLTDASLEETSPLLEVALHLQTYTPRMSMASDRFTSNVTVVYRMVVSGSTTLLSELEAINSSLQTKNT